MTEVAERAARRRACGSSTTITWARSSRREADIDALHGGDRPVGASAARHRPRDLGRRRPGGARAPLSRPHQPCPRQGRARRRDGAGATRSDWSFLDARDRRRLHGAGRRLRRLSGGVPRAPRLFRLGRGRGRAGPGEGATRSTYAKMGYANLRASRGSGLLWLRRLEGTCARRLSLPQRHLSSECEPRLEAHPVEPAIVLGKRSPCPPPRQARRRRGRVHRSHAGQRRLDLCRLRRPPARARRDGRGRHRRARGLPRPRRRQGAGRGRRRGFRRDRRAHVARSRASRGRSTCRPARPGRSTADDRLELAVCSAPGERRPARRASSRRTRSARITRGKGTNTRYVRNILPETTPTPTACWSSR